MVVEEFTDTLNIISVFFDWINALFHLTDVSIHVMKGAVLGRFHSIMIMDRQEMTSINSEFDPQYSADKTNLFQLQ